MIVRIDEQVHSKEDVLNLGIQVGDYICYDPKTVVTESGFLKSRFIDDKGSVACLLTVLKMMKDKGDVYKRQLDPLFEVLTPNRELENTIDNAVLSEEELADSASAELASLRRKINQAKLRVRERLDQLIKSPTQSKYLQEALVTQRDGRFAVSYTHLICSTSMKVHRVWATAQPSSSRVWS